MYVATRGLLEAESCVHFLEDGLRELHENVWGL